MDSPDTPPKPPATPESIIDILYRKDGDRMLRPVHAIGIAVRGYFQPSSVAARYCRAAHFQAAPGRYQVVVRFSNGSGCKDPHDNWSDVRGMATRFTLPATGGAAESHTDLIAMTLAEFFSKTPDDFQEFAWAARPVDYVRENPWRKLLDMLRLTLPMRDPYPGETISPDLGAINYATSNDTAKPAVLEAAGIGAPVSYLRSAYHAVHTFFATNSDGVRRPVRFSWQPVLGVKTLEPAAPYDPNPGQGNGDNYLQDELRHTLVTSVGRDHPRFSLMMTIGEAGDVLDDPSRAWPPHRTRIMMGTLSLEEIVVDPDADCEKLCFNPGLLTDGIEMSADKVLQFRVETYKLSGRNRGAKACPFAGASAHDIRA